ncbi:MAG: LacI family DNA-binding transcriptional regulator [Bryobacteraceae bacterium]
MKKRIGVREIARLAGVPVGAVDRALNGRKEISQAARERVLRIAERRGYRPNLAARALSSGGAGLKVGVCIPREIRFFYDPLPDGILEEAARCRHMGLKLLYDSVQRLDTGQSGNIRRLLESSPSSLASTASSPGN